LGIVLVAIGALVLGLSRENRRSVRAYEAYI